MLAALIPSGLGLAAIAWSLYHFIWAMQGFSRGDSDWQLDALSGALLGVIGITTLLVTILIKLVGMKRD